MSIAAVSQREEQMKDEAIKTLIEWKEEHRADRTTKQKIVKKSGEFCGCNGRGLKWLMVHYTASI